MSERLPRRDGDAIDRDRAIRFTLDGKRVAAYEGDTIGSAIAAAGFDITARSFKYHRPRGLFCMTGSCPNCLMQVDGIPNVRTCTEPVRDGMRVQRQNAWPSVDRDIHGWLNTVSFMMPPGFYYKVFQHPRWAWPTAEPFIRSKAGLGTVPRTEDHDPRERITLHPDVLVIGAGPAGLAAAAEASGAGLDTLVLEQEAEPGGSLLRGSGEDPAGELRAAAESSGVRILTGTAAFGVFEGPLIAAANSSALYRIRARHIVMATGAIEQPVVFPNNDLPGVMLSSAAEILINRFGVLPGRTAVVLTASEAGHAHRPDAGRRRSHGVGGRPSFRCAGRRGVSRRERLDDPGGVGPPSRHGRHGRSARRGVGHERGLRPGGPGRVLGAVDEPGLHVRCPGRIR